MLSYILTLVMFLGNFLVDFWVTREIMLAVFKGST
jgi:hypothetical protein